MTRLRCGVRSAVVAALLYAGVWLALSPPPLGSLTALLGGLLGLWIAGPSRRRALVSSGTALGLVLGVGAHARVHVVEDRWSEFLWGHALGDAARAAVIAGAILAAVLLVERCASRPAERGRAR